MNLLRKIFIFEMCKAGLATSAIHSKRHLESPALGLDTRSRQNIVSDFSAGLFICSCFHTTLHNSISYSSQDKGACKRCTLIHKIIGSGKIVTTINKWVCSKLLPTTETTTVNDTTAESEFLSLIPFMGVRGINFIASLFQLHSLWLAPQKPLYQTN